MKKLIAVLVVMLIGSGAFAGGIQGRKAIKVTPVKVSGPYLTWTHCTIDGLPPYTDSGNPAAQCGLLYVSCQDDLERWGDSVADTEWAAFQYIRLYLEYIRK